MLPVIKISTLSFHFTLNFEINPQELMYNVERHPLVLGLSASQNILQISFEDSGLLPI